MKVKSRVIDRSLTGYYRAQWIYSHEPVNKAVPLPYLTYDEKWTAGNGKRALNDLTLPGYGLRNPVIRRAYAKAYDKFVESAFQDLTIQMGANLGEAKQTLEMIAHRAGQLLTLAKDLRRGKVPSSPRVGAYKRFKKKHGSRGWAQVPGGWWLEYHFAWSPLLGDIYTGCQMLSEPVWEFTPITERGSDRAVIDRSHPRDWRFAEVDVTNIEAHVSIRGNAKVVNKNLYLANRMGLINPASVAWELVPFSFAVDWFLPVSSFLSSYTDSVGWEITRGQLGMKDTADSTWVVSNPYDEPRFNIRPSKASRFQRDTLTSLPIPGLFDRRGNGIKSITRGATAIALLVGFLRKNP